MTEKAGETPDCEHDWVEVPEGSLLTGGQPFRFCRDCDREEWQHGVIRR